MRKISFFDTLGNFGTDILVIVTGILFLTRRYTGWSILYIFAVVICAALPIRLLLNKAGVDVFLELSCFFDDPTDVGNMISGSSAFSKSNLNIWKFMVHILLKPGLENFEHYFSSV